MTKLTIVKVGGAVVEDELQLSQLLKDFSAIEGRKVLVHGGGRKATKMAERLGIETHMVNGRRITDADMLEVVTMVYGGLVNKNLVARLQANGVNALGLTGADADVLRSHRRPPVVVSAPSAPSVPSSTPSSAPSVPSSTPSSAPSVPSSAPSAPSAPSSAPSVVRVVNGSAVDYGFVGDVDTADGTMLSRLIEAGITPVMAPLTHDGQGTILNTNADTIASETAKALAALYDVTLIFSFEKKGVLRNPDDDDSVIPVITRADFERYKADGTISGGMLPKIENALKAVEAGVSRVIITLATAIDGEHGTIIK